MVRILLFAVMISALIGGACRKKSNPQADVSQAGKPAAASASPGASLSTGGPPAQQGPLGVYVISEVDHREGNKNVADMIPSHREIQLWFRADGSFVRIARRQGIIVLSESGTFRIDLPDQLVMRPDTIDKQPVLRVHQTNYKFALSADGDELRLWGATKGNVAVFHRTNIPVD